MTTSVTSPAAQAVGAGSLTQQWARFFSYLRRPMLPQKATGFGTAPLVAIGRLFALDVLMTLGVLGFFYLLTVLGIEAPDNALGDLDLTLEVVLMIVVAAPLAEETIFRGWLSGRPGHVFALLLLLLGGIGSGFLAGMGMSPVLGGAIGVGIAVILAILATWYWRNSGPWRWFAKLFPVLLPLSALLFASVHILNYEGEMSALLIVFVIPQFLAGLIFGYARVNYGIWSSMLLHFMHNGTAVAAIMLFSDLA